jgi:hypothetical protein
MGVSISSLVSRMSSLFSRTTEVRILMLGLDSGASRPCLAVAAH